MLQSDFVGKRAASANRAGPRQGRSLNDESNFSGMFGKGQVLIAVARLPVCPFVRGPSGRVPRKHREPGTHAAPTAILVMESAMARAQGPCKR